LKYITALAVIEVNPDTVSDEIAKPEIVDLIIHTIIIGTNPIIHSGASYIVVHI